MQRRPQIVAGAARRLQPEVEQMRLAVLPDQDVVRADRQMADVCTVQLRNTAHQRHEQRARLAPRQAAARLRDLFGQRRALVIVGHGIDRPVLLKDVVHRDHRGQILDAGQRPHQGTRILQIRGIRPLAAAKGGKRAVRAALAQAARIVFADEARLFQLPVEPQIHQAVAALVHKAADQIMLLQDAAHRQAVGRVLPVRGITADGAFLAAVRQRVHAAHTDIAHGMFLPFSPPQRSKRFGRAAARRISSAGAPPAGGRRISASRDSA